MKKNKKIILLILLSFLFLFLVSSFFYFFIGEAPQAEKITWGAVFSRKYSEQLGLNWKENYKALFEDLGVNNIKIITHWDLIEPVKGNFDFNSLDKKINIAEENESEVILTIGMKTGRWPECHIPQWAHDLEKEEQQERILKFIKKIVLRYKDRELISAWQVENEPLFPFGECPWTDKSFLEKEFELVRSLDERPLIMGDSGEFSFWIKSARIGDIIAHTLHRKTWFSQLERYVSYPFPPVYYWRKKLIIENFFGTEVICGELQAEPWGPAPVYMISLEEQEKTMNLERFKENVKFAKRTGMDTFYFWGVEWWYWMKETQENSEIWEESKPLFY